MHTIIKKIEHHLGLKSKIKNVLVAVCCLLGGSLTSLPAFAQSPSAALLQLGIPADTNCFSVTQNEQVGNTTQKMLHTSVHALSSVGFFQTEEMEKTYRQSGIEVCPYNRTAEELKEGYIAAAFYHLKNQGSLLLLNPTLLPLDTYKTNLETLNLTATDDEIRQAVMTINMVNELTHVMQWKNERFPATDAPDRNEKMLALEAESDLRMIHFLYELKEQGNTLPYNLMCSDISLKDACDAYEGARTEKADMSTILYRTFVSLKTRMAECYASRWGGENALEQLYTNSNLVFFIIDSISSPPILLSAASTSPQSQLKPELIQ
jgi:hypothetical protein